MDSIYILLISFLASLIVLILLVAAYFARKTIEKVDTLEKELASQRLEIELIKRDLNYVTDI